MKILADWKDLLAFIAKPTLLNQETTTLGKARIFLSTYLFKIIVTILLGLFFVYMLGLKEEDSGYMAAQLKGLYHPIVLLPW